MESRIRGYIAGESLPIFVSTDQVGSDMLNDGNIPRCTLRLEYKYRWSQCIGDHGFYVRVINPNLGHAHLGALVLTRGFSFVSGTTLLATYLNGSLTTASYRSYTSIIHNLNAEVDTTFQIRGQDVYSWFTLTGFLLAVLDAPHFSLVYNMDLLRVPALSRYIYLVSPVS